MRISSDKWTGKEVDKSGKFVRQKNRFDTPFGEEEGQLPVEAGRYRLLWAPVCPWAHRSIIVRKLLGLDQCRKSRPKASECIKKRLGIYPG